MTISRNLSILAESAGAPNTPVLNLPNAGEVATISAGVDIYVYTIVKTGSAAFTVFASQTQFK